MNYSENLISVAIEDLAIDGSAVGKHNGKVIFLDSGLPGEIVNAVVIKRKARYDVAKVRAITQKSPERIPAVCSHFDYCGGCSWQDLTYARQLDFKQKQVVACMERLGEFKNLDVLPIVGCEKQFGYRNKMEFSFDILRNGEENKNGFTLGLHRQGKFDSIFDLDTCHITTECTNRIVAWIREFVAHRQIPIYDLREHHGLLRFLVIRHAKATNQVMINIVTGAGSLPFQEEFVSGLMASFPEIATIVQNQNSQKANIAVGEVETTLYGPGYIEEELLGVRFRIRANSFFQTNPYQVETLYKTGFEQLAPEKTDHVLDLYCGTGAIGLLLADKVERVLGVEEVPDAIVAARENAEINQIENASFVQADVRAFLKQPANAKDFNVAVVDPPRAGMHPKVLIRLTEQNLHRILYISCNPSTFARDAKELASRGYDLPRVIPVDMFPHTRHIELVGCFTRR